MSRPCLCLVPFCHHTTGRVDAHEEWICAKHWRLVPRWMKRRWSKIRRLWRKAGGDGKPKDPQVVRARIAYWRWWDRIKIKAIERAVGISA